MTNLTSWSKIRRANGVSNKCCDKNILLLHIPNNNIFMSVFSRLKCSFTFFYVTFFEDPVEATHKGQNYYVLEGTSKTLTCPVAGNPEPNITWYNSSRAPVSNKKEFEAEKSDCYICVANNFFGTLVNIIKCLILRGGKLIVFMFGIISLIGQHMEHLSLQLIIRGFFFPFKVYMHELFY